MQNLSIDKIADEIFSTLKLHLVISDSQARAITLWLICTYLFEEFHIFPRLAIISPVMRCGKSSLMDVIYAYCLNGVHASNATAASIFRLIDQERVTLLIDEADTFLKQGDRALIGILNSGHSKRGSVQRNVKVDENWKSVTFGTFSPVALACIGSFADTLMDRSIRIPLRRKKKSETVVSIPVSLYQQKEPVRKQLASWAKVVGPTIHQHIVDPPDHGNSRAVDNWRPLFTAAMLIGKGWDQHCANAYSTLEKYVAEEPIGIQLLSDISDIALSSGEPRIFSTDLANQLCKLTDRPWNEYSGNRPISPNKISRILKDFDIHSRPLRIGNKSGKGYEFSQFADAFEIYLPLLSP